MDCKHLFLCREMYANVGTSIFVSIFVYCICLESRVEIWYACVMECDIILFFDKMNREPAIVYNTKYVNYCKTKVEVYMQSINFRSTFKFKWGNQNE